MSINDKPLHQQQWQYLSKRSSKGTLPHALIFSGVASLGKFEFAVNFAQYLLCAAKNDTACENCSSCKLMQAQTHPDFFLIQPDEKGKQIKVAQIRELTERLNRTAHCRGYQIAIIQPAEAMNIAACNALLKTLEEPLGQVIIILITQQRAILPATIRSRCQHIGFTPPDNFTVDQWLFHEQKSDVFVEQLFFDFTRLLLSELTPLEFAEQWSDYDLNSLLTCWQMFYLDLLKVKCGVDAMYLLHQDKYDLLYLCASKVDTAAILIAFNKLFKNRDCIKNNLNRQLLLEDLAILTKKDRE